MFLPSPLFTTTRPIQVLVMDLLSRTLLTGETVDVLLKDVNEQLQKSDSPARTKHLGEMIRRMEHEIDYLTQAIRPGGPIERFVSELRSCEEKKVTLVAYMREERQ